MKLAGWLRSVVSLACLAVVLAGAGEALATPLPLLPLEAPGPTIFAPVYVYAVDGAVNFPNYPNFGVAADAGGAQIASLPNVGFTSAEESFSGTLSTQVLQDDASNPYYDGAISSIPGALTFVFTLTNNATTDADVDAGISRISLNSWAGIGVDATEAGSGTAGFYITRSSSSVDGGNVVGVNFTNFSAGGGNPYPSTTQLVAGTSSVEIILHTNATSYATSYASVIGGADTASNVGILVPAAPEPGSIVLLLTGMAVLGLVGWRRRFRSQA